jgi:predicted dehydrogenase
MDSPGSEWVEHQHQPLDRDVMFVAQAQAFLDAVEGRSQPLCTLDEAVQTLRCNLAALKLAGSSDGWQQIAESS